LAAEVTLQPIRRFGFDAAILFSDILIVPLALGRKLEFKEGDGPRLDPMPDAAALKSLKDSADEKVFAPIYETVSDVKTRLDDKTALIGFCGAPWTVATYMVAGRGTPDQAPAKDFTKRDPTAFAQLIDQLVEASVSYLSGQIKAGAEVLQIFDTWAGSLDAEGFERWCIEPTRKLIAQLRTKHPEAKVIGFPRGAGEHTLRYVEQTGVNAIGLGTEIDRAFAREKIQARAALQGNLDPEILRAGGDALDRQIDDVLAAFGHGPFIFNLGHGILPDTPIAHVERMVARVRER
jgi:uroporphyrinogen decarboxylase